MRIVLPTIEFEHVTQTGGGIAFAPRPQSLNGKVVGFLDGWAERRPDGSYAMYPLMEAVLRRLEELFDLKGHVWRKKPHVSRPVPDSELDEFLTGVDVVVNGECA